MNTQPFNRDMFAESFGAAIEKSMKETMDSLQNDPEYKKQVRKIRRQYFLKSAVKFVGQTALIGTIVFLAVRKS